jgi:hypothetical protein
MLIKTGGIHLKGDFRTFLQPVAHTELIEQISDLS